ncbi:hypothetical protein [Paraliomyxa miuraensis]|uniref:hypothetical protein n=1 Tax=Paraliomyxa miuraensis TaxID=376150 RepID=UPI002256AEA6|nr:hypothetical protein [Paraliomyxa miuraensis]MCX4245843.1 hypothetical protein [Paraliomyxa miuraensis]
MPSALHEMLVELLRRSPDLVCLLLGDRLPSLRRKGLRFDTDHTRGSNVIEVGNDLVLKVRDRRGKLVCALVIEVQLHRKPAKARTWALYAAWAHYRLRCPVHVVVIAVDASVAKWAAGPFCIGDMTLRPWVIGPEHIEPITSITKARRSIDLAFLSSMAHRDSPVAKDVGRALLGALRGSSDEHAGLMWDIFVTSVDAAVRRAIEMEFGDWVPQSDWAKKHYSKGRREGKAEGRREGKTEGEANAVLLLLKVRRIRLTKAQQHRVHACRDIRRLRAWLRRAVTATTVAEVFRDA